MTLACASSNLASPANKNSDFQEIESCFFDIFDSELSEKDIVIASSNIGWIEHYFKYYKIVKKKFIKFFRIYWLGVDSKM